MENRLRALVSRKWIAADNHDSLPGVEICELTFVFGNDFGEGKGEVRMHEGANVVEPHRLSCLQATLKPNAPSGNRSFEEAGPMEVRHDPFEGIAPSGRTPGTFEPVLRKQPSS